MLSGSQLSSTSCRIDVARIKPQKVTMKIGVYFSYVRSGGGQYQFLVMLLDALFRGNGEYEVYLLYESDEHMLSEKYRKENWFSVDLSGKMQDLPVAVRISRFFKTAVKKLLCHLGLKVAPRRKRAVGHGDYGKGRRLRARRELVSKYRLDFMFFPIWTDKCWEWGIPFGFAVHDLQHRLQPEFQEVSSDGRWLWREEFFAKSIAGADIVLVDSEEGRRNVHQFYECGTEKIEVLPYTVPSSSMIHVSEDRRKEIVGQLHIPHRFFFYPAQLWPHKNHYRIVEAIGILKKKHNLEIPVVFVGSSISPWNIAAICETLATSYAIESQIHYLNYVSDEELTALYMTTVGLVMPTWFGPTNIPYLEAFHYRCPIIASDLPGIREQVGKGAILVNPRDTEAISEAMYGIWTNPDFRDTLIEHGQRRLRELTPDRFSERVDSIMDTLSARMTRTEL